MINSVNIKREILWCLWSFIVFLFVSFEAFSQKAVSFASPGDFIEVPHSPSLAPAEFTIEFWLMVRDLGDPEAAGGEQTILDKRGGETGYNFRLAGTTFPVSHFAIALPGDVAAYDVIDRSVWHHIAVTQDQDSLKIYFNGELAGRNANIYASNTDAPLRIGEFLGYPGAYLGLRGAIDELRIWNTARSQAEVQSTMHEKLTGSEASLAAYWDFDNLSDTIIKDLSPNGNDGTIYGNTTLIDSEAPIGFIPPEKPVGLRAYGQAQSIDLAWKPGESGVSAYEIYRGDSVNFLISEENLLATDFAPESTYTDNSVETGRNYIYRLRAVDAQQHASQPCRPALSRTLSIPEGYYTGVYYYPWYGPGLHEWDNAYVREYLVPEQPPMLGEYSSRDSLTIRQHLEWMQTYGIDFLVSSWWGQHSSEEITLSDFMLPEIQRTSIKFTLYYESAYLGFSEGGIVIDNEKEEQLVSDFNHIADTYFDHPNFLKIDGKPVVFVYLAGALTGDYMQAFSRIRTELAAKGYDLFLVGDEVGWGEPSASHMQFLDAVSPYIMFGNPKYEGYPVDQDFFADISLQIREWEGIAQPQDIFVIPDVHPGFNGNHGSGDGMVAPRQSQAGAEGTSMLEEYIKVVRPFVDPELKMIMITSWNEWHEDTQIEPTIIAPATSLDNSVTGNLYTQGYPYEGYGLKFLELVRSLLASEIKVSVDEKPGTLHAESGLIRNYPNPFHTRTTIQYQILESGHVDLKIYNGTGQLIAILKDGDQAAGEYTINWNGKDNMGMDAPAGLYLLRLEAGKKTSSQKMLIIK